MSVKCVTVLVLVIHLVGITTVIGAPTAYEGDGKLYNCFNNSTNELNMLYFYSSNT